MSDRDASSERPPYWAKCEKMSFLELYWYIDRASEKLADPSVPDNVNLPRSQQTDP